MSYTAAMHLKLAAGLTAILGALVFACAGESPDPSPAEPVASAEEQDLSAGKRRCGTFLHGTCPGGYACDMSSVPPGSVGGSGVCRKKMCIQSVLCASTGHFDHATCKCVAN